MNGYAENNRINVRRTQYGNVGNTAKVKVNNVHKTSASSQTVKKTSVTVAECAGTKERYRASKRNNTAAVSEQVRVPAESIGNQGFAYVEHSGVVGTFKDVFFTKRVKSKEKSCFDKVVTILLFAVLLFFVAGSYCEYHDAYKEVKDMEQRIAQCREEQTKLLMAIEERDNFAVMEEYAINNLGMVKSDKLTRHFVNISEKDVVRITADDEAKVPAGGVVLSGFKSIVSNLFAQK